MSSRVCVFLSESWIKMTPVSCLWSRLMCALLSTIQFALLPPHVWLVWTERYVLWICIEFIPRWRKLGRLLLIPRISQMPMFSSISSKSQNRSYVGLAARVRNNVVARLYLWTGCSHVWAHTEYNSYFPFSWGSASRLIDKNDDCRIQLSLDERFIHSHWHSQLISYEIHERSEKLIGRIGICVLPFSKFIWFWQIRWERKKKAKVSSET